MQDEGRLGRWLGASSAACNMQVGAVCRDHGLGRDSSLEVFMAPGILATCRTRQRPPGVYLGGFEPGGNSLDPAGQALQRVGEVHFAAGK